ncbi:MAG: PASTA domain-containing protein [bacterium]
MQAAVDPLLGHQLEGRYRIRAPLAVGGMSTVYAATDERLEREVAVKIMAPSLSSDPVFVDRFAREARTAAKLSHINAVSVYDQGSDGGLTFLVMELVHGRTLRDLLRERGRLSPAEAVSIMEPVLLALAAAHRAGLVHRDVKPENILLSDEGLVKVADFGLARAVEANAGSTRTGLMMGTVAYSSPEQFRGSSADIRSDVYSAGIVLFELLTGRTPYSGPDSMAVAYQHVHQDVPAPSSRQRGIAAPLDALVQRATSRDPMRRPPDAGAFLAALHEVRSQLRLPVLRVPARPRTPGDRPGAYPAGGRPIPHPANGAEFGPGVVTAPAPGPPGGAHHTLVDGSAGPARGAGLSAPARPAAPPPSARAGSRSGRGTATATGGPGTRRPRRWLRTLVGTLVLVLAAVLITYGSWWFASGRYSSVPDVSHQRVADATARLRDEGFQVATNSPVADDTVPRGEVIDTEPGNGARLVRGRTVHLVVSGGPTFFRVPDVAGKSRAAARTTLAALAGRGVRTVYSERADDSIPAGAVVGTSPKAGAAVKKNDVVTVFVSTGAPLVDVPDETGQAKDDAVAALETAKFTVTVDQQYSDTVAEGTVIRQDPSGGSARKFSTVRLVVSGGPQLVTVPELGSFTRLSDARDTLEAAGFEVKVRQTFGRGNGLVVGVDPPAGTRLRKGATVTLYVV